MSTLIAITYDTADKATQALEKLGELQKMQLVTLEDAAVAVRRAYEAAGQTRDWAGFAYEHGWGSIRENKYTAKGTFSSSSSLAGPVSSAP